MSFPLRPLALAAAIVALPPYGAKAADPLPALDLSGEGLTVSGLSSGAYMAVQFHVAHSAEVDGAGVVAGGPWYCAEGSVFTALYSCMKTWWGAPNAEALFALAGQAADAGQIDDLSGLVEDRVYLFHGTEDQTVTRPPMDALRAFYRLAGAPDDVVRYVTDIAAGHAFIAEEAPVACAETESPYLNDCDFWMAGRILGHLYPGLAEPGTADPDRLFRFDQAEFLASPESHGLGAEGFVYIPERCEADPSACRLHIAFAGCRQTLADIGDLFPRTSGFNRWAETNDLVVLYPQSHAIPAPWYLPWQGNPRGCWDWWGYDDPNYATREGRQVAAVTAMAERLGIAFSD